MNALHRPITSALGRYIMSGRTPLGIIRARIAIVIIIAASGQDACRSSS
jgi:hypothetical protein